MNAGLVSVIIPFYNAEAFLEEAVASVLAQTFTDWELLLVDDGSTDSGTAIAHDFATRHAGRIRRMEHPGHRNHGVCASRNLGIRHSQGEYVAFLDADDVWLPPKLAAQVALMRAQPEAGLVCGHSEYWYDWNGDRRDARRNHIPALVPDGVYDPPSLLTRCHPLGTAGAPCPSDFLLRRDALDRVGGFEECFDPDHQLYEDQAFLAKVYLNVSVFVAEACWDRYRCHEKSCSSVFRRTGREEFSRQFYFEWLSNYLRVNGGGDPEIRRAIARRTWRYRHPRLFATARAARHPISLVRPYCLPQ